MAAADALRYDPSEHRSWLADGTEVPHVTAVLAAVGVTTDFEALANQGGHIARAIEAARALGTAVHADCHSYDDNDLDWTTVDPRVLPYVEAWAQCRSSMSLTPVVDARERRVYYPTYNYTGIFDGIFVVGDVVADRRVMIDIKTGDPESSACHLQTAAYVAAFEAEHNDPVKIRERWAVWLQPDRSCPYTITNYSARPDAYLDFGRFAACLTVYAEQPARRRRIR